MSIVKRILSVLMVAVMIFTVAPVSGFDLGGFVLNVSALESSGECGDEVEWTFDSDTGTVTVSGEGDMEDYVSFALSPFYNNDDILHVIIEDGVTSVGDNAFRDCTKLQTVVIGDDVEVIGEYAFNGCYELFSVDFGDSVEILDMYCFCNTILENLTLPESTKEIRMSAFLYVNIGTVYIPSNVEKMDLTAFEGYNVSADNQYFSSDSTGVLFNKDKTELIKYPERNEAKTYTIPDEVVKIKSHAFSDAENLEEVIIPDGVKYIGSAAFQRCTNLKSIEVPGGVKELEQCFSSCPKLQNVTLNEGLEIINWYTFSGCDSLQEIVVPDTVKKIYEYAFANCAKLETVYLGKSVAYIDVGVFSSSKNLEKIIVDEDNEYFANDNSYALYDSEYTTLIQFPAGSSITHYSVPDTVTVLPEEAFFSCANLEAITLPDGVREIGHKAFAYCENLESLYFGAELENIGEDVFLESQNIFSVNVSAQNQNYSGEDGVLYNKDKTKIVRYFEGGRTSYTIRTGVEEIGNGSFAKCRLLETLNVPSTVKVVGARAFYGTKSIQSVNFTEGLVEVCSEAFAWCSNLSSIEFPDSVRKIANCALERTKFYMDQSNWENGALYCGNHLISVGDNVKSYTIKSGTISVAGGAASAQTNIEEINFPESVVSIGDYAFCAGEIKTINLPDSLEYIGEQGISCLYYMETINFGAGLKELDEYAFANNVRLKSVELPDSLTTVAVGTFNGCTSLYSVVIPGNVPISERMFCECYSLSELDLGEGIEEIPEEAFAYCTDLISVELPESVTSIGYRAFSDCQSLEEVTIGKNVKEIRSDAFDNCYNLTDIYYTGSESQWNQIDIESMYNFSDATIHFLGVDEPEVTEPSEDETDAPVIPSEPEETKTTATTATNTTAAPSNSEITQRPAVLTTANTPSSATSATEKTTATTASTTVKNPEPTVEKVQPVGLGAKAIKADSVKIIWNAVNKAEGYEVYYSKNGKKWTKLTADTNSLTVSGLDSATKYKFKVVAVGSAIDSEESDILSVATVPDRVTIKTTKSLKEKKAKITWKTVEGVNGYQITYSTSKKFTKKTTKNALAKKQNKKSITINKLKRGKKYYFKVRAYKTVDGKKIYGAYSKVKTVKIK